MLHTLGLIGSIITGAAYTVSAIVGTFGLVLHNRNRKDQLPQPPQYIDPNWSDDDGRPY